MLAEVIFQSEQKWTHLFTRYHVFARNLVRYSLFLPLECCVLN